MTSTALYPPQPALLNKQDEREQMLLTHPSWQFPAVFSHYRNGTPASHRAFHSILQEREHALGAATLSTQALLLLFQIGEQQRVPITPASFCWHAPTRTASETQRVLPSHVTVLKTVTVTMSTHVLLWTTIGDGTLTRPALKQAATMLGLPKMAARHSTINPASIDPEGTYALRGGMVSPFLPPGQPIPLSAVVFAGAKAETSHTCAQEQHIALSLSRYESLLVPQRHFPQMLRDYALHVYPQLFIELH